MGGLLHLTGYEDRPPVRPGVIISDYLTGVFNALSVGDSRYEAPVSAVVIFAIYRTLPGGGGAPAREGPGRARE
jgi:hypothetical protein